MASEYRHNHYVPVWYQKRFLPPGQADRELQYLDFQPGFFIDGRGVRHEKRAVKRYRSTSGRSSACADAVTAVTVMCIGRSCAVSAGSIGAPARGGDRREPLGLVLARRTDRVRDVQPAILE